MNDETKVALALDTSAFDRCVQDMCAIAECDLGEGNRLIELLDGDASQYVEMHKADDLTSKDQIVFRAEPTTHLLQMIDDAKARIKAATQ